jgi:peptidoglycan/xylan/chitin deacetylase (PgdA/CDA1 family)
MTSVVQKFVRAVDAVSARAYLSLFRERNALVPFLFHSLFRDEREIGRDDVDPLERTTVGQFRQLVAYYLDHGYRFVSPADLLAGLDPDGRYAMLTFDDGYYNNALALSVLREFRVPALFFISTEHVRANKCFWWDVLYRERRDRGASPRQIYLEGVALKALRTEQIEAELSAQFGPGAFTPRGDVDRPFAPEELREFARDPLVHLGNHTANHAILTNYTPAEARAQVETAQSWLRDLTGVSPTAIAYPNGGYDQDVVQACRDAGLRLGFTVRPEKTPLPIAGAGSNLLRLGRFVPHAEAPMPAQCRTYRSDFLLYGKCRAAYLRLLRRDRVTC